MKVEKKVELKVIEMVVTLVLKWVEEKGFESVVLLEISKVANLARSKVYL
jgi:predicted ATP-grasp superfamily ATP-dependent carboligase